jgi:DsbC/DsbD-like thiol-disulfide interchange protein
MPRLARLFANCAWLLVFLASCSRTAPQPPIHSRVSFILENAAVQPGSQVNVGIQFVTDKGWHIYWQNPGDSGEPPKIQWQLPAGVIPGTLEWPIPKRLNTSAGADYGYEGTTVLLSALQIPPTARPGTTMELGGELRWLVCHDICVPQRSQLRVPIRIASATTVDDAAHLLLRSAAERIPKPLPARLHPTVGSSPDGIQISLVPPEAVKQAEFFPSEVEQIDNQAQQTLNNHRGVMRLTLKKSAHLRQDPERLSGVIVLNGRDAYQLDAPVNKLPAAQKER